MKYSKTFTRLHLDIPVSFVLTLDALPFQYIADSPDISLEKRLGHVVGMGSVSLLTATP